LKKSSFPKIDNFVFRLAHLFEKAGVLTLCLLSLLHYYMQQNMQNNVPCALIWFSPFQNLSLKLYFLNLQILN